MTAESDYKKLYTITYKKDGVGPLNYQIPATNEYNALVRLGQIYGDRPDREDREVEILDIKVTSYTMPKIPDVCWKIATWWDNRKLQRRIVCAANRFKLKDGGELVIPGSRHYSPDMAAVLDQVEDKLVTDHAYDEDQGFIDQWGEYHNREDALVIATHAGQINTVREKGAPYDKLFSEDLY